MNSFFTRTESGYTGIFASRAIAGREIVGPLPCTAVASAPTRHTVQVSRDCHIEVGPFAHLNHSCVPNLVLDTRRMLVLAVRAIAVGEELAYFYPSTEWAMAEPFTCRCGQPACIGLVRGARFLPDPVLQGYWLDAHIRELLAERSTAGQLVPALATP